MKYFIADNHFYHENVIAFNDRPFADVAEMNATMIARWNKKVTNKDEIYILGDFIFRGSAEKANELLQQLRGKKYLIRGNHDDSYLRDDAFDAAQFVWIKDYYTFKDHHQKFVLFHYPMLEWEGYFQDAIHLYGHTHNTRVAFFEETLGPRAVNVGADMLDFTPISLDEIRELVAKRIDAN